ncbi:MAG: 2'-5' RNA ligase family protein [Candidatus Gracilibacteria bacterium]|nr:2'-5' RNA ligase family protein [Candidatus Gracilibacteria bacterium]
MKTTSHFIGVELNSYILSNIFIKIYQYIKDNCIESCVSFQNPLSPHITLYYLDKDIHLDIKNQIKDFILSFAISNEIKLIGFDYFYKGEGKRYILYLNIYSKNPFKDYRNILHDKFKMDYVIDNSYDFSPHITILKINNPDIFENHRLNIESILKEEINKIKEFDVNLGKISLYAVNSKFKEEIQIRI